MDQTVHEAAGKVFGLGTTAGVDGLRGVGWRGEGGVFVV